jgi:hypothetical protein
MSDLEYCIENFHRPRIAKLAEFLLNKSEFPYDYFEPPVFETYMIQVKLDEELIISINYFPIVVTEESPYLFLQLHCVVGEMNESSSSALLNYLSYANNEIELSVYRAEDNRVFLKSVLIDDANAELDIDRISFLLRIFYNNLRSHIENFKLILEGSSFESVVGR